MSRKSITSFLGGDFSFLKLGSVLVGFSGVCQIFLESQLSQNCCFFEVKYEMCVLACRLDLGGHLTNCKFDDVVGL